MTLETMQESWDAIAARYGFVHPELAKILPAPARFSAEIELVTGQVKTLSKLMGREVPLTREECSALMEKEYANSIQCGFLRVNDHIPNAYDVLMQLQGIWDTPLFMVVQKKDIPAALPWHIRQSLYLPLPDGTDPALTGIPDALPEEARRLVYGILRRQFDPGKVILKADVGSLLKAEGFDYGTYGFSTLKGLVSRLTDFLIEAPAAPGRGAGVILQAVPAWDNAPASAAPEETAHEAEGVKTAGLSPVPAAGFVPRPAPALSLPASGEKDILEETLTAIYEEMKAVLPMEEEISMPRFSLAMSNAGFGCRSLGFSKMKQVLPYLARFLTYRVNPESPVSDLLITLHPVAEWEEATIEEPPVDEDKWEGLRDCGFGTASAEKMARLPHDFSLIHFSIAAQNAFLGYMGRGEGSLSEQDFAALEEDYAEALARGLLRDNKKDATAVDFPTHFTDDKGQFLFFSLAPNIDPTRSDWFSRFCGIVYGVAPHVAPVMLDEPPAGLSEGTVMVLTNAKTALYSYLNDMPCDFDIPQDPGAEAMNALRQGYDRAVANGEVHPISGGYLFDTGLLTLQGQPLQATLRPSLFGNTPWALTRIEPVPPRVALERWAYMGIWDETLAQLEDMALAEDWSFNGSGELRILKGYVCYTFYRLQREAKVLVSADGKLAAFNTGLVNDLYDDIYAVFLPNGDSGSTRWKFCTFCVEGSSPWGKALTRYFKPMPQPARYFEAEDLLYDWNIFPIPSYEHIIRERIYRWPVDVLRDKLRMAEMQTMLDAIESTQAPHGKLSLFGNLAMLVAENPFYERQLTECLDMAIRRALKRVRWNYQSALPSYFPARNKMSLMLPIDLTGTGRVDFALVVERQDNGSYIGQTILTMDQAYVDARLISRPDKDWLNNVVMPAGINTDEDDELMEELS